MWNLEASWNRGNRRHRALEVDGIGKKIGGWELFQGDPFRIDHRPTAADAGHRRGTCGGERNTTLYNLVRELRYICDFSQARLMQVVPRWGLSENEVSETVQSALATVRRTSMPPHLERALRFLMAQQTEISEISDVKAMEDGERCGEDRMFRARTVWVPMEGRQRVSLAEGDESADSIEIAKTDGTDHQELSEGISCGSDDGIAAHSGDVGHGHGRDILTVRCTRHRFSLVSWRHRRSGKSCTRTLVDLLMSRLQQQDKRGTTERTQMDGRKRGL